MILRTLELKYFRGFRNSRIDLDPRLTVFVGGNGAGKSSVLDALSILLDQYSSRLLGQRSSAKRLTQRDARRGSPDTSLRLTAEDNDYEVRWTLHKQGSRQRLLRPISSELSGLNDYVRSIANNSSDQDAFLSNATLPIYYDQRRGLAEVPQRKRAMAKHSAKDAFEESRGKEGLDLRSFVFWFEEREIEELRLQRRNRAYQDPQLLVVREAIQKATGFTDLSYRAVPPRGLTVRKHGIELGIDQLSTGERVFLAMAGDLARRIAMLSASREVVDRGHAIVLIDEIELHLHPSWQRSILPWLLGAFPKCQFIVSTHSPQVIGDIEASHIRILNFKNDGNEIHDASATKGRDTNYLLLNIFGAVERSIDTKRTLSSFEEALKENDLDKAEKELNALAKNIEGSAPEISIAEARLQRRRVVSS